MTTPVRIQRKRVKGFNLQEESLKINGLPAKNCTRPGKWGNPYRVLGEKGSWFVVDDEEPVVTFVEKYQAVECIIELFREYLAQEVNSGRLNLNELKDHNLACFCKLSEPCHVDVLLDIVRKIERPEGVK